MAPGFYSFPGWSNLKNLKEEEARKLGMGYRAKYLVGTAQYLSANSDFLKEVQSLPYFEARSKLMKLPGVGPKVADCILLFGAEKNEAFPDRYLDFTVPGKAVWDEGLEITADGGICPDSFWRACRARPTIFIFLSKKFTLAEQGMV